MGRIAEQYLVNQITDLQNLNHTLEKKVEELQKIVDSQDDYIGDLEKGHDFLTSLFKRDGNTISTVVTYWSDEGKFDKLIDLCGFIENERR